MHVDVDSGSVRERVRGWGPFGDDRSKGVILRRSKRRLTRLPSKRGDLAPHESALSALGTRHGDQRTE